MRSRRLLAPLGVMFLLAALPSFSADKPAAKADELRDKVKALVAQLADKDPDKQDEAAALLLKLGPDVLPFLPRPGDKLADAQKKALAVVRKTLRDQQIKRDLAPRLVTIEDELTPTKALAELAKQTGTTVEDRRENAEDTRMKLKLKGVTFWEAVETIAREADARVSVYERDGTIALQQRPEGYQTPPTHYNGLFRTQVRRVEARRDLESETSRYVATLEIAWEPRFRPFILELKPQELSFKDDKGKNLSIDQQESDRRAVSNKVAVTFDVPLPALDRATPSLGFLKGAVNLIGPTRMETFDFPSTLAEMVKDPRAREVVREGVTVKVDKLDLAKDHWSLVVALEYPADGPQFESFESWLVHNEMRLRKKGGGEDFPPNGGYNIEDSGGNRAILSYHFVDERGKKLVRGGPEEWTPSYRTPGLIVEVPAAFEFKNVPLP